MRAYRGGLASLAAASVFFVAAASSQPPADAEVWLEPSLYTPHTYSIADKWPESAWHETLSILDYFIMYRPFLDRAKPRQLSLLAAILEKHGIGFGMATGGIHSELCATGPLDTLGERSASIDIQSIDKWLAAGGSIDMLQIDGPARRVLYTPPCTELSPALSQAGQETADYMVAMKEYLTDRGNPAPRFNLIVNFPNWNYGGMPKTWAGVKPPYTGDYEDIFAALHEATLAADTPFYALVVDNPQGYAGDRIRLLARQAQRYGMKAVPYINAYSQSIAAPNRQCSALVEWCLSTVSRDWRPPDDIREQSWLVASLAHLGEWIETTGRKPEVTFVGTWMMHPRSVLPETTFGTLTYDLVAVTKAVDGEAIPIFDDRSRPVGAIDPLDNSIPEISGWALDLDEPGTSIYVHIYKDGKLAASVAADSEREDANEAYGITGKHGFLWTIPNNERLGVHSWRVYAVNYQNKIIRVPNPPDGVGDLVELQNSPQTFPRRGRR